jgi:hypothetical protein
MADEVGEFGPGAADGAGKEEGKTRSAANDAR